MKEFIERLQAIAKKNGDEFNFRIEIHPCRDGLSYQFICEESMDTHEFLSGVGDTIEDAIADAKKNLVWTRTSR